MQPMVVKAAVSESQVLWVVAVSRWLTACHNNLKR